MSSDRCWKIVPCYGGWYVEVCLPAFPNFIYGYPAVWVYLDHFGRLRDGDFVAVFSSEEEAEFAVCRGLLTGWPVWWGPYKEVEDEQHDADQPDQHNAQAVPTQDG